MLGIDERKFVKYRSHTGAAEEGASVIVSQEGHTGSGRPVVDIVNIPRDKRHFK